MKHSATLLFSFILFIGDFLALVAAFTLAFVIRVKLDDRPLLEPITAEGYIAVVAVLLVFWIFVFALLGLYRSQVFENRFKEALMLFIGSFIGILFLIGAEYVLNRAIFPARLVTVYGFIFAFMLTLLFRTIARAVKRTLWRLDIGISNVLIVGNTDISKELVQKLSAPNSGYKVIGIVGDRRNKYPYINANRQFASFAEAAKKMRGKNITSIVQTELYAEQELNDEILTFAQEHHVGYRFVPGNSRLFAGNIDVNLFEGIPTVAVHQTALVGWGRIVKRLFDVVGAVALIILSSPILILIYAALLVSGGSPIYRRSRMTRFNSRFDIYKFRSMKIAYNGMDPEEGFEKMGRPDLAIQFRENGDYLENDPRVSRFGVFLRKTSLDELPQLFNVVKGELSLVGPRPLIPEELNNFKKKNTILSVKPGITGLAVVSGRKDIPFEERRKLDMYYAQNWSFLLDIVILLKTAVVVVQRAFSGRAD